MADLHPLLTRDISPAFTPSPRDAELMEDVIRFEATDGAIKRFVEVCDQLTDYGYWFGLSTLWVSYSGWSDLELWKLLFQAPRRLRRLSIMKPSELRAFDALPKVITAYRAHRPNEKDWISYTLDPVTCAKFAAWRDVDSFSEYRLRKVDCLALFLRRGEKELLMLEPTKARFVKQWSVQMRKEGGADG